MELGLGNMAHVGLSPLFCRAAVMYSAVYNSFYLHNFN